jgi:hypothetical protein
MGHIKNYVRSAVIKEKWWSQNGKTKSGQQKKAIAPKSPTRVKLNLLLRILPWLRSGATAAIGLLVLPDSDVPIMDSAYKKSKGKEQGERIRTKHNRGAYLSMPH